MIAVGSHFVWAVVTHRMCIPCYLEVSYFSLIFTLLSFYFNKSTIFTHRLILLNRKIEQQAAAELGKAQPLLNCNREYNFTIYKKIVKKIGIHC